MNFYGEIMYLEHFSLDDPPFALTPDIDFQVSLPGAQEAMNVLLVALAGGEGFIKITGEVGTGKTLLCRRLLAMLEDRFATAYVPNPLLNPCQLHRTILEEFGFTLPRGTSMQSMLRGLNKYLITTFRNGRPAVLCIDEAQTMPTESLEAVRLLSNLETGRSKLLQIVLFGQPELDSRLRRRELRQLRQRITFSYQLPALRHEETTEYVQSRLRIAGSPDVTLFTPGALRLLHRASQGIPRLINIVCHKALLAAYGRGSRKVDRRLLWAAVRDTEEARDHALRSWRRLFAPGVFVLAVCTIFFLWPGVPP